MATKAHSLVSVAARHPIVHLSYPDAANRAAGTNETNGITAGANNIHDVALQIDTGTYWILDSVGPLVWSQLLTGTVTALNPTSVLIANATGDVADDGANFVYAAGITTILKGMSFATAAKATLAYETAQTPDCLVLELSTESRNLVVCEKGDASTDFGHAQQTNPTVYIQSADATTPAQWISLVHDQTDGVIATGAGNLKLNPAGLTQIGAAGSSSRGLGANDCFCSADLEVDGSVYFELGGWWFGSCKLADNVKMAMGAGAEASLKYHTGQTPNAVVLALSTESRNLIICETGDDGYDFAHAQQTNPTVFFQSSNQSATEWGSLGHDQTDFVIDQGAGTTKLAGGVTHHVTNVNVATYDLAIDDYFLNVIYTATNPVTALRLMTAQALAGRTIHVKDAGFNAGANNITITTEGGELIDNGATYVISTNGESVSLYSDGTDWLAF